MREATQDKDRAGTQSKQAPLKRPKYAYIKQTAMYNTICHIITKDKMIIGSAKGIEARYSDTAESDIAVSACQLMDALLIEYTSAGGAGKLAQLPVALYIALRGLKNRKEARKQLIADLNALRALSVTWKGYEQTAGNECVKVTYTDRPLIDSFTVDRRFITVRLSNSFASDIACARRIPYPIALLAINNRYQKSAYHIGRKIIELRGMNRANTTLQISVKALLQAAPLIPSYREVINKGRQTRQLITDPFERSLEAAAAAIGVKYHYSRAKGEPLTDRETKEIYEKYGYSMLETLFVRFTDWQCYPTGSQSAAKLTRAKRARRSGLK